MEGLRNYLLTQKKDIVIRLFCRRLLGYALGRAVVPSDQPLIEQMIHALNQNQGHITSAVLTIVNSPQFRTIRGQDFVEGRDTPRKNPQLPRILQRKTGVSSG